MSEKNPDQWLDLLPPVPYLRAVGLQVFPEMAHEDDDFVLAFWRALRRIQQSVDSTVPCSGSGDADPSVPAPASLADALSIVSDTARLDTGHLSVALTILANWAEERNYLRTSVVCAELAACVSCHDPWPAILSGRLGRRLAEYDRAEAWYTRGAALARQAKNWELYVQSLLWHGFLHFQKGEHREAERKYRTAGRAATRYGRRALAGVAHHNLLTIASDLGHFEKGARHAAKALSLYPIHYPRVPHLVHDYGFLLARNAYFGSALPLFESVYPYIRAPHERVVVVGNIARAAGGARVAARYRDAMREVMELASLSDENSSRGFLGLAEGAHCLGDFQGAVEFARRAADVALRRGDKEVVKLAAGVVENAERGVAGPLDRGKLSGGADIARECIDRLQRWTARPRGQAVIMLRKHLPKQPTPTETAASTGWRRPA
jgi:tetratricopeptide (TPR) repeat protein